jgi:hypothetical protein
LQHIDCQTSATGERVVFNFDHKNTHSVHHCLELNYTCNISADVPVSLLWKKLNVQSKWEKTMNSMLRFKLLLECKINISSTEGKTLESSLLSKNTFRFCKRISFIDIFNEQKEIGLLKNDGNLHACTFFTHIPNSKKVYIAVIFSYYKVGCHAASIIKEAHPRHRGGCEPRKGYFSRTRPTQLITLFRFKKFAT